MRIRLRRGLDLPIGGAAAAEISSGPPVRSVALLPDDHPDVQPELLVAEGEHVALGAPLLRDRRRPDLQLVSPACGRVARIERGPMRRVVAVVVELRGTECVEWPRLSQSELEAIGADALTRRLLEAGAWAGLRERPFGRIPTPGATSAAIFVRAMDSNPLAPDSEAILAGRTEDWLFGLLALTRLAPVPVFVSARPGARLALPALPRVERVDFAGPHPAGLAGTHIHHLVRVDARTRGWYLGHQEVLAIGQLLRTGRPDTERVIALAGPVVRRPRLLRVPLGASSEDLVEGELTDERCRILSGPVLAGRRALRPRGFLGRHHEQLAVLPEDGAPGARAWRVPGVFGTRRALPWRSADAWGSELHGAERALLPLDVFERVVPLRLPVVLLLRALAAGDVEAAESFGALELEEEDLALCSHLCPSKLDYGRLLRTVLHELEASA